MVAQLQYTLCLQYLLKIQKELNFASLTAPRLNTTVSCIYLQKYIRSSFWLTDGLCCTISCRSHSRQILSNHWHTVIAWGRIWGWLKCVITPSSCACSNVHIECIHKRSTLESDLVLCDDSPWTLTCFHRVQWILEGTKLKNNKQIKISELRL